MNTGKHRCFFHELVFICVFILLNFFTSFAQDDTKIPLPQNFHQWGAVTLFNGLPSDAVRAIAQTPDGIWWFGTENGLARFDGRRVQNVALESAAEIFALKLAPDGTLFVGSNNGIFNNRTGNFRKIEATENLIITDFLFAENIFASTRNGAILRLSETAPNNFQVEKNPGETLSGSDGKPLKITSLAKNADGKIIAGTHSRSILVLENNRTFETFSRSRPFFVNTLAQGENGKIFLGANADKADSGFFVLENIGEMRRGGNGLGNVSAIVSDGANGAWIGTQNKGLFHFSADGNFENFTFENTAGGLRSNTIYAVFVDREGVLWLGTNRGACRFDRSSPTNQLLGDNSNSNFVRRLFQSSDGKIYAGTNRGLFVLAEKDWLEIGNFSGKMIFGIGADTSGKILLATAGGLLDFEGKNLLPGEVRAIANFRNKTYAAVFGRGIFEVETRKQIFSNDSPTAIFADGDQRLLIGTVRDGIFSFDGKDTKSENAFGNLRGTAIRKIFKGTENDLWLAGEQGLFLHRNGELQTVVADADVRDAIVSDTEIWAATLQNGIVHARFDKDFGWLKTSLDVEQGLSSEQIFALLQTGKKLLVGTNRGTAIYAPSSIEPQIIATRVLSQRLHSPEEILGEINLEYPQNSLLIEVAGLSSRTFPEQFQYAFVLKNSNGEIFDKKLSNDSQFAPSNLSAGEHVVEVRVFNKDLLASAPLVVRFSVAQPPFPWTATALGVLLFIALLGLIWAMIERRRLNERNRELAVARFDLANEAERERKRIARDLHDQTLADLRNLMLMSDKLPTQNSEFRTEIESVSTEIRRICEDLSPSVLENVGLAPALEFLLQHNAANYKFSAGEDLDEKTNFPPNVQMQIYRVAQEVLNNIKRHSDAKNVEMKIEISPENEFVLSIADDGKLFSPNDKIAQGRGIANIKSRAALIEAEAEWTNDETTIFYLKKNVNI